jgi:general secretion pathway protein D
MPLALSTHRLNRGVLFLTAAATLAGCVRPSPPPPLAPLDSVSSSAGVASVRQDGSVGRTTSLGSSAVSYGTNTATASVPQTPQQTAGYSSSGPVTLDFADTDIRAVAAQILGSILHLNYTIDPGVHGTVSLHTSTPVGTDQLLPTLEVLLAQVNATLVSTGALYRVVPSNTANVSSLAASPDSTGSEIIPLRYVGADDLVRALQPFVSQGSRVAVAPGGNAVVIAGDPTAREALAALIAAFDADSLAGQSFALFPVDMGSAKDMANALQQALQTSGGGATRGQAASQSAVTVIPMERINAVLVTAHNASAIAAAQRIFSLMKSRQDTTTRTWTVYYLQNGHSNDVAYVLQQAFTPDHVTATPTATATLKSMSGNSQSGSGSGINGIGSGGLGSGGVGGIGGGSLGGLGASGGGLGSNSGNATSSASPLLGGLDASSGGDSSNNEMRIVPDNQDNALLIYGTPQETNTVQATLRKIDIIPLQVRIDAVIAEVQLNDQLRYGTQFFFKSGGLNGTLTSVFNATNSFNGYFLAGSNASQVALDMLQAVSTVHVLSSPELIVQDNQPARLEVGDLVPYLTSQSQSTLTSDTSIINSVSYEQTGVILEVTPRVSSDGLVTLDIAQEVSNVTTASTSTSSTNSINSPTFAQRDVQSRVVVQNGQTIGLAGLIQDNLTRSNQGVPFIKDIPVVGALFGQQNNTRTRSELLILITPHVIHDQRDALDLTQDLREQLPNAAAVPQMLQQLPLSGSDDPTAKLRNRLGAP